MISAQPGHISATFGKVFAQSRRGGELSLPRVLVLDKGLQVGPGGAAAVARAVVEVVFRSVCEEDICARESRIRDLCAMGQVGWGGEAGNPEGRGTGLAHAQSIHEVSSSTSALRASSIDGTHDLSHGLKKTCSSSTASSSASSFWTSCRHSASTCNL